MYDPRNYALQFTKAIRTANTDSDGKLLTGRKVRLRTIRLHGLRHTYASYLARSGQPPAVIQRLLGHATPDLALRVYTHVMQPDLEKATLDLDDIIGR
jgi:integrase